MKAIRGNFFNNLLNLSRIYDTNGSALPSLIRLRWFSTTGGKPGGAHFRRSDYDKFNSSFSNDEGDGKYSGNNRRNLSPHHSDSRPSPIPGRPLRSEREKTPLRRQNATLDRNYRHQERESSDKFGDVRSRTKQSSNDSFMFDGDDEGRRNVGLDGYEDRKRDSRPSISELLNSPPKAEEGFGKEGRDFLDKFKLGVESKKENKSDEAKSRVPPHEEKMEPTEDAEVIFKKMKQSGLIPNAVAMLDGLCKDGLVQEAMKLFGVMREKGTMPEVVVYTAVVEGFCQAQKLDDAKRVFRKMESNGIVPNAFSYTVLIKGLCRGKRLEDAVDFCSEMVEAGHSPNVTTFTGMVHEFCQEKGVEEAQDMIGILKKKGFCLDEKAIRNYLDKTGPVSPMVWEAIFGPKKAA